MYSSVVFYASINDYFDSKSTYSLISLSDFTNNKESLDRQISQNSNSRLVTRETRAYCWENIVGKARLETMSPHGTVCEIFQNQVALSVY